jgi:hypothetical protein
MAAAGETFLPPVLTFFFGFDLWCCGLRTFAVGMMKNKKEPHCWVFSIIVLCVMIFVHDCQKRLTTIKLTLLFVFFFTCDLLYAIMILNDFTLY